MTLPERPCHTFLVCALTVAVFGLGPLQSQRQFVPARTQQEPKPERDYIRQMDEYALQGRYDEAVQAGRKALRKEPADSLVYQGIAGLYLFRAQKEPSQRERWVATSITFAEKALLADRDNPINGVECAKYFANAGDLSAAKHCSYNLRALELTRRVASLLNSDHFMIGRDVIAVDRQRGEFTAFGKVYPIAAIQKENNSLSAAVEKKIAYAHCH